MIDRSERERRRKQSSVSFIARNTNTCGQGSSTCVRFESLLASCRHKHGCSLDSAQKEIKMAEFHQRFTPSSSSTTRLLWSVCVCVGGPEQYSHRKKG